MGYNVLPMVSLVAIAAANCGLVVCGAGVCLISSCLCHRFNRDSASYYSPNDGRPDPSGGEGGSIRPESDSPNDGTPDPSGGEGGYIFGRNGHSGSDFDSIRTECENDPTSEEPESYEINLGSLLMFSQRASKFNLKDKEQDLSRGKSGTVP